MPQRARCARARVHGHAEGARTLRAPVADLAMGAGAGGVARVAAGDASLDLTPRDLPALQVRETIAVGLKRIKAMGSRKSSVRQLAKAGLRSVGAIRKSEDTAGSDPRSGPSSSFSGRGPPNARMSGSGPSGGSSMQGFGSQGFGSGGAGASSEPPPRGAAGGMAKRVSGIASAGVGAIGSIGKLGFGGKKGGYKGSESADWE